MVRPIQLRTCLFVATVFAAQCVVYMYLENLPACQQHEQGWGKFVGHSSVPLVNFANCFGQYTLYIRPNCGMIHLQLIRVFVDMPLEKQAAKAAGCSFFIPPSLVKIFHTLAVLEPALIFSLSLSLSASLSLSLSLPFRSLGQSNVRTILISTVFHRKPVPRSSLLVTFLQTGSKNDSVFELWGGREREREPQEDAIVPSLELCAAWPQKVFLG